MSVILCLFFLAASSLGANLAPQQVDHFFDAVLEEGRHLVTVTTNIPDNGVNLYGTYPLVSWEGISIRGPTNLARTGSTVGFERGDHAHAEAMVKLGQLNLDIKKFTINLFGHSYSTELHLSILSAEAPITVDVFRNNLATCEVSVNAQRPTGHFVVHFGAHGAPSFVSALLDYGISYLLQLSRLDTSSLNKFIPDLTSRINRELTIAARRVAC